MFWSIFLNSVALILAILVIGWGIDYLVHRRSR